MDPDSRNLLAGASLALTLCAALPALAQSAGEAAPVISERAAVAPAAAGPYADPQRGVGYADPAVPLLLRGRLLLAADARGYDDRNVRDSGLRLDRALVGVEGAAFGEGDDAGAGEARERLGFRVLADLRGIDVHGGLEEAWASVALPRALRLRGGLLKIAPGVEHALPEETLPFVDYAFPAFRAGSHDWGLGLDGELGEGLLSYDLVAGAGEGFDAYGLRRDGPQVTARLTTYPLRFVDAAAELGPYTLPLASGFFASGALSWHDEFRGFLDVGTSLRNKLFLTRRLRADDYYFWYFGYGVDLGPFRLIHEFTRGSLVNLELPTGGERSFRGQFTAWSASFAWRITGEPYDSRPYRQRLRREDFPARPLYDPATGAWGPGTIEVAVRYSNTEFDRAIVDLGLTNPRVSSQEARAFDVAVNWWPWRTVRVGFQLTRVIADEFPAVFRSHGRDTSFLFRLQLDL